jgi:hypothetical protein
MDGDVCALFKLFGPRGPSSEDRGKGPGSEGLLKSNPGTTGGVDGLGAYMRPAAPFTADREPALTLCDELWFWFWVISNSAGAFDAAPKLELRGADFLKLEMLRARAVFWLIGC